MSSFPLMKSGGSKQNWRSKGNETMCRAFEEKYQKGRADGREEGQIGTAQKMLAAGKLALEEIAEYTSLPLEKVKRMAAELAQ